MSLIEKRTIKTPLDVTKAYFYNPIAKAEYRRVVGGIAWPFGQQGGFIVVIAENYPKDTRLKTRRLRVLTEYLNDDTDKLVKRLYDLQNTYLVGTWYGETDNLLMMHFIDQFNRMLPKKKVGVFIAEAPFADDRHNLRLYAHQIYNKTNPAKKSLFFDDHSIIPGILSALSDDQVRKDKAQKHPVIAALGFAVSGLNEPYHDISKDRMIHETFMNKHTVIGL